MDRYTRHRDSSEKLIRIKIFNCVNNNFTLDKLRYLFKISVIDKDTDSIIPLR